VTNPTRKLLDTKEAAEFLGTAPATLVVWRSTKRYPLPFFKIGGAVGYAQDDLTQFIESRRVAGAAR